MSGYRVLDIETVPDDRYWTRNDDKWDPGPLFVPKPGDGIQTVGGDIAWRRREQFPPPQAHRIVAIAWADLSGDDEKWYSWTKSRVLADWAYDPAEADAVEKRLLLTFQEAHDEAQSEDLATLVTWNGRCFDLPVITCRSFLHGVACKWYYTERDVRYRYTEAGHCDVMDFFSDYGAGRPMKLHDAARLAGLPGKVGPVRGENVAAIYEQGRTAVAEVLEAMKASVGAYCLVDVLETACLFARSRVHRGMIDLPYYERVVAPSLASALGVALEALRVDAAPAAPTAEETEEPPRASEPAVFEATRLLEDIRAWSEEGPVRLDGADRKKLGDLITRLRRENKLVQGG